jgi:hypothetical protein
MHPTAFGCRPGDAPIPTAFPITTWTISNSTFKSKYPTSIPHPQHTGSTILPNHHIDLIACHLYLPRSSNSSIFRQYYYLFDVIHDGDQKKGPKFRPEYLLLCHSLLMVSWFCSIISMQWHASRRTLDGNMSHHSHWYTRRLSSIGIFDGIESTILPSHHIWRATTVPFEKASMLQP